MAGSMTFRKLEEKHGVFYQPEKYPSSLSDWYVSVRDRPLDDLNVGDMCCSIRQDVFVSDVLPFAMGMLDKDVLIGEFYDGELVTALARLDKEFWHLHMNELESVVGLLHEVSGGVADKQLFSDVSKFIDLYCEIRVGE